jgi:hypothetical protein
MRLFYIGVVGCLVLTGCGSDNSEPTGGAGATSSNNAGSGSGSHAGSTNNAGSSNGSGDGGVEAGGTTNGNGDVDGGGNGDAGTGNGGSSGNIDPTVIPSGDGFVGVGTYDGTDHEFNCTSFETGDGNIASYTEQIDLYTVQCRSTDGTHQIRLSFPAPMAGETVDYTEGGVAFGPIDGSLEGSNFTTVVVNSITFEDVTTGMQVSGTFEAEWEEGPGDDFVSGPAASCSGAFNATIAP